MAIIRCEGWWEQQYVGRQPMRQLTMSFADGSIKGDGVDVVGPFVFDGSLQAGQVRMRKQYFGRHHVEYTGQYDGEGTLHGTWHIDSLTGPWVIRIGGPESPSREIREIVPLQ